MNNFKVSLEVAKGNKIFYFAIGLIVDAKRI